MGFTPSVTLDMSMKYGHASLLKMGTDECWLHGDLVPVTP